ncbi:MAG: hypothetical protein IBX64_10015 [Actinobacteria bacterium]|nr:hypothetical protein [Actinomycetota bacterium]
MEIVIDAFEESIREDIRHGLEEFIAFISSRIGLDLESLEYFVVPKNFGNEVITWQEKLGLPTGYTKTSVVEAGGKLLTYRKDNMLKMTMLIDSSIIGSFFNDELLRQIGAFYICHELCHVHDGSQVANMLGVDFILKKETSSPAELLRIYAEGIWTEYYASRLSAATITLPLEEEVVQEVLLFPTLMNVIEEVEAKAQEHIAKYRWHADIGRLFEEFKELGPYLLKIASRTYGHLDGLSIPELLDSIASCISDTYFSNIWGSLGLELQKQFDNYPNWSSVETLDGLANIIVKTWNALGIYPDMSPSTFENGIYVDVPWPND